MHTRCRAQLAAAFVACILAAFATACFEPPVSEKVELRVMTHGGAIVSVTVAISGGSTGDKNPLVRERVEQARREQIDESDPWSRRIRALEPDAERTVLDKSDGGLDRIVRKAHVEDPGSLKRFFGDTMVGFAYDHGDGWAEIAFRPGSGSRAGSQQRDRMKEEMRRFSDRVAHYLGATRALYSYLRDRPERARACFAVVFKDILPEEGRPSANEVETSEKPLVSEVQKAMSEVLQIFDVPADAAYSFEEISRLVHDPFPAPLTVRVPRDVLEVEGFSRDDRGRLAVPGLSLWSALESLAERWVSPDPIQIYYKHMRSGQKGRFDLEKFLARPRRAERTPSAEDVSTALEEHLKPAAIYRVRWRTPPPDDPDTERAATEEAEAAWAEAARDEP